MILITMKKSLLLIFLAPLIACNKNKEHCWQTYDALGNRMAIVCGKTESEIQAEYGPFYDRADAKKFCWKIKYSNGAIGYIEDLSEKMANYWYGNNNTLEKVACGYCQKWSTREKDVSKATGHFFYKSMVNTLYCGDTCSKLFPGKMVILRETADSIIYHEFVQKLP